MFYASIIGNNYNNPRAQLHLQTVTVLDNQCYNKFKNDVLAEIILEYYLVFKKNHFVQNLNFLSMT